VDIFDKCLQFNDAKEAEAVGLYPFFIPIEKNMGNRVIVDGKELVMIGSNNYLGLSHDPRVKEAAIKAIEDYGTSCSGSRFLNGTLSLHEELEHRLADFAGKEAAAVFSTGYQTNLGSISALVGKNDHIFTDRYNHASIMDGIFYASGFNKGSVHVHRYHHNNMDNLEKRLKSVPHDAPKIIVSDGVFSMEGDIVNLPRLKSLADQYNARVYLDEAHAIGTIGRTGKGTEEHYNVKDNVDIVMCTFSKSFGSLGGFVAGDKDVIHYIKHFSRSLIFSASLPPSAIAAVMKSLEILQTEPEHVQRLQQIGDRMLGEFKKMGFNVGTAQTPIIPLIIGDFQKTLYFWKALFVGGVYTNPVFPPAVPPDRTLLRTSYMAILTDEDLDYVLEVIYREAKKLNIITS